MINIVGVFMSELSPLDGANFYKIHRKLLKSLLMDKFLLWYFLSILQLIPKFFYSNPKKKIYDTNYANTPHWNASFIIISFSISAKSWVLCAEFLIELLRLIFFFGLDDNANKKEDTQERNLWFGSLVNDNKFLSAI